MCSRTKPFFFRAWPTPPSPFVTLYTLSQNTWRVGVGGCIPLDSEFAFYLWRRVTFFLSHARENAISCRKCPIFGFSLFGAWLFCLSLFPHVSLARALRSRVPIMFYFAVTPIQCCFALPISLQLRVKFSSRLQVLDSINCRQRLFRRSNCFFSLARALLCYLSRNLPLHLFFSRAKLVCHQRKCVALFSFAVVLFPDRECLILSLYFLRVATAWFDCRQWLTFSTRLRCSRVACSFVFRCTCPKTLFVNDFSYQQNGKTFDAF
jgi:hypothetical protein